MEVSNGDDVFSGNGFYVDFFGIYVDIDLLDFGFFFVVDEVDFLIGFNGIVLDMVGSDFIGVFVEDDFGNDYGYWVFWVVVYYGLVDVVVDVVFLEVWDFVFLGFEWVWEVFNGYI